ncbi:MAG: hypothetical protein HONBIEJF_00379 [Fimbriimonadaceae bacterium]|nr:hypothetical protein [Fimbriimonadaceae bacterium]
MARAAPIQLFPLAAVAHSEDDLLHRIAQAIEEAAEVDGVAIVLRESDGSSILGASTLSPEQVGRLRFGPGVGISGLAMETGTPVLIPRRLIDDASFVRSPAVDYGEMEAALAVPMAGEHLRGALVLLKSKRWQPSPAVQGRLKEAANEAALTIAAFRNAFRHGADSDRLTKLSEVTRIIKTSPYLEEILQLLVNVTAQQFGYRVCTVRLLDETRNELVLRATQASDRAYQRKRAIKLGESIAGRAIAENRAIFVRDVQKEESYIGHDLAADQGLCSMICIPLTIQNRPVGVMSCYTDEIRDFPPDEVKVLETLANQAAMSIEHAKLQVRSTLMQEMHHRVKNNLQQVASLLRLQVRQQHYKSLEEAINDSLSRILAISAVHDLLSREDLDFVGLRSIAESLVHHLQQALIPPEKSIEFDIRGEDIRLSMNQATQVALILNELIQNAVEHGFKTADEGEVHVNFETKNTEVALWVSNSGNTLPPGFDASTDGHLGLQIVQSLVRGLGGQLRVEDRLGWTVAEVVFTRSGGE